MVKRAVAGMTKRRANTEGGSFPATACQLSPCYCLPAAPILLPASCPHAAANLLAPCHCLPLPATACPHHGDGSCPATSYLPPPSYCLPAP